MTKKLIKILILLVILNAAFCMTVFSDSTLEVLDEYIQREEFKNMFEQRGAASSLEDAGTEIISGFDGSVSYQTVDLSLKGKGDSLLELKRHFSSNVQYNSDGSSTRLKLRASYETGAYRITNKYVFRYYDSANNPIYIAFDSIDNMLNMENGTNQLTISNYSDLNSYGFQSYYSSNGTLFYSLSADENEIGFSSASGYYLANEIITGTGVTLTRDISNSYALLNLSSLYTYYVSDGDSNIGADLGYGWSYELPVFQYLGRTRLSGSSDYGEYDVNNVFYDPIEGSMLNIEYEYELNKNNGRISMGSVWIYNYDQPEKSRSSKIDSNKYTVEINWSRDYNPKYIYITRQDGIKYTVIDNKVTSVTDRYGNAITISRTTEGYVINDSLGRKVRITDSGLSVNGIEQIKFEVSSENNQDVDPNNKLSEDDIITYSCKKVLGENSYKTTSYELRKVNTKYYVGSLTNTSANPFRPTTLASNYIVNKVVMPGGGEVHYRYNYSDSFENYRPFVERGRYTVAERFETFEESATPLNRAQYSYQVNYENPSETHKIISTVIENITYPDRIGYTQKNTFDKYASLIRQENTSTNSGNAYYEKKEYTYSAFNGEGKRNMLTMKSTIKSSSGATSSNIVNEEYEYDSFNNRVKITRDGTIIWFAAYNSYNRLNYEYSLRDNNYYVGKIYNYSSSGKYLYSIVNSYSYSIEKGYSGDKTEFDYSGYGDVTKTIGGGVTTNISYSYTTYDDNNPSANSMIVTYSINSVPVCENDSESIVSQTVTKTETYDYLGRLVNQTDGNNNTTQFEYDGIGRNIKVTNPDNTFSTVEYNDTDNTVIVTDETGLKEKSEFDGLGRFFAGYKHDGTSWKKLTDRLYDVNGCLTEIRVYNDDGTQKGRVSNTYYSDGNVKDEYVYNGENVIGRKNFSYMPYKASNTASAATKVYSSAGSYAVIEQQTDKYGYKTKDTVTYDSTTLTQTYTTDKLGNIISIKDFKANAENSEANTVEYTYDFANRILTEVTPAGTVSYTYNATTGLLSEINNKGVKTKYTWNVMGLLSGETVVSNNNYDMKKIYSYDAAGNVTMNQQSVEYTSAAGYRYAKEKYLYDNRNRLVSSAVKATDTWVYDRREYDSAGRLLKKTEGLGNPSEEYNADDHRMTEYQYDIYGNLIGETDPMGYSAAYQYNLMGQLVSKTDKNGTVNTYVYDVLNRLLSKSYSDEQGNTDTVSYTYNMLGKVLTMVDNSGITQYNYDKIGNMLSETKGGTVKTYTYDANGNRASFNLSISGTAKQNLTYTYDAANRMSSVTDGTETTTYTYDGNNNILNETTKAGSVQKKSIFGQFNSLGLPGSRTTATSNSNTANLVEQITSISYYPDGSVKSYTDDGVTVSYTYDDLRRVTSEVKSNGISTSYTYDKFGNMTSKTSGGIQTQYSYDKNNRLISGTETNGDITNIINYSYDRNGNMINTSSQYIAPMESSGENLAISSGDSAYVKYYSYDGWNRLTSFNTLGMSAVYTYDGNNLRQQKTVTENGTVENITHTYDGMNIVYESAGTGETAFIRGNNLISAVSGTDREYYILNHRGDITGMFDSNRQITANYSYDAFGNQQTETVGTNPFRYCGEYWDSETGFIYLRNRYYDPSTGRFISEDPIKDGLNWYVYCENNPVRYIDPTGYWANDGSDERFKDSNPIVYQALSILTDTWNNLDALERQSIDLNIDIQKMKKEVAELANLIRSIGDSKEVKKPLGIGSKLNSVEMVLYSLNPSKGKEVIWAGFSSRKVTEQLYGNGYAVNDNSDAFRHSYWNAASTALVGEKFTANWTNAHEYGFSENFTMDSITGTYMDLFNNGVGRYQGVQLGLGASEISIKNAIIERVNAGGLFRIINGALIVTDSTGKVQ